MECFFWERLDRFNCHVLNMYGIAYGQKIFIFIFVFNTPWQGGCPTIVILNLLQDLSLIKHFKTRRFWNKFRMTLKPFAELSDSLQATE